MNKLDSEGKPDKTSSEPFADEARYYTESRLLQRDVQVILETFNNNNFVGSIIHPVSTCDSFSPFLFFVILQTGNLYIYGDKI